MNQYARKVGKLVPRLDDAIRAANTGLLDELSATLTVLAVEVGTLAVEIRKTQRAKKAELEARAS